MTRFIKLLHAGKKARPTAKNHTLVIDSATHLMWTANDLITEAKTSLHTFEGAADAVSSMNQSAFGGFTDWRVPTLQELFTLADHTRINPAIDTDAFPRCKGGWYWTSTPLASSPSDCAWSVGFSNGSASYLRQYYSGRVRAVRSVLPASPGQ